jgi:IclR family transcriptional regulator, acetate operon repressor
MVNVAEARRRVTPAPHFSRESNPKELVLRGWTRPDVCRKMPAMDVKTAGRTVEIFELFSKKKEPLSLSEVSRALSMPMSSCLYLVRALENRGYLYCVGARKNLYPTRKIADIAKAIAVGESWLKRLEPKLSELRDATQETAILGKRQGKFNAVYIAVLEGPQTLRYSSEIGDLKPLHSSAIGKALLLSLDPVERQKLLEKIPMPKITETTISDPVALVKDLEAARKRGYAVTLGENVSDVMAIAKTVRLGSEVFGISVAGPLNRMKAAMQRHATNLIRICREIETDA